jgi:hypothetical protein
MTALIRADSDSIDILLNSSVDDFLDRTIVGEMNDLGTTGLKNAAHDIDGSIMTIEKTRSSNEAKPFSS